MSCGKTVNFGPFESNKSAQDGESADRVENKSANQLLQHVRGNYKIIFNANYQIFPEWRNPILPIMLVLYLKRRNRKI
jgi:hypothetical protein